MSQGGKNREKHYEPTEQSFSAMSVPDKCQTCGKEVIGFQGFGCCAEYVCADHANPILLALKPGERKVSGECYFERYR